MSDRTGRTRRLVRSEGPPVLFGLLAVLLGLVAGHHLLEVHPNVPVSYTGDANLALSAAQTIRITGWFVTTDQLGVPWGQDLRDFPPIGDAANISLLWVLAQVGSPAFALNAFYFGSYVTVFLGAYAGARLLGIRRQASVFVGLLTTFVPYHFQHGPGHLFLASYWAVPLWVALLVRHLGSEPLLPDAPGWRDFTGWWGWLRHRSTLLSATIVLVATTTGLYYALFFGLLSGFVALVAGLAWGARRALSLLLAAAGGCAVLVLQALPAIAFQVKNGSNLTIVTRGLLSVEFYSLKLSDMLLPVAGHRLPPFARLQADAQNVLLTGERTEALGIVGVISLAALVVVAAARVVRDQPCGRVGPLVLLAAAAFVLGTVGGLGQLLGVFGFTQVRAWSRISVVIAFVAFVAAGVAVDAIRDRWRIHRGPVAALLVVLATVAFLDMTPATTLPDQAAVARDWADDRALVGRIEKHFGPGSSVFQLPLVPFPENPPVQRMVDYDHLRGYLHSTSLRWSYGGVKGRAADWQRRLEGMTPDELAVAVAGVGFDALWLDRYGFGSDLEEVESAIERVAGLPVTSDGRGRVVVYDLRPVRQRSVAINGEDAVQASAAALTDPTQVAYGTGFSAVEIDATGQRFAWALGDRARLQVRSPELPVGPVEVRFVAASAAEGEHSLRVRGGGVDQSFAISPAGTEVVLSVDVGRRGVSLLLTSDAPRIVSPDPRDLRFRVFSPVAMRRDPPVMEPDP